jgi:hypothetical protein
LKTFVLWRRCEESLVTRRFWRSTNVAATSQPGIQKTTQTNDFRNPAKLDLIEALFAVASGSKRDHVAPVLRLQRTGEAEDKKGQSICTTT